VEPRKEEEEEEGRASLTGDRIFITREHGIN
jgi:hypothetical protein